MVDLPYEKIVSVQDAADRLSLKRLDLEKKTSDQSRSCGEQTNGECMQGKYQAFVNPQKVTMQEDYSTVSKGKEIRYVKRCIP